MRARRRSSTATRPGSDAGAHPHREARHGLHRRVAVDRPEHAQVVHSLEHGPRRRDVDPRGGGHEAGVERARGARHGAREGREAVKRVLGGGEAIEGRIALGPGELDDGGPGLLVARDPAAAHASLGVVDPPAGDAREGAAQVREEILALASGPGVAQRTEERDAERGLRQRHAGVDRDRDAEGGERRLERCPVPGGRGHDDADLLGGRPGPDQRRCLGRDHVGDAAPSAGLEQAHRAGRVRRRTGRGVGEERPLEVGERRMVEVVGRIELADRRALRELLQQRAHRRVGGPVGLVRQRNGHVRPRRERPESTHLGDGHVLEPVGEHRPLAPGVDPRLQELGGPRAHPRAVGELERVERRAVSRDHVEDLREPLVAGRLRRVLYRREVAGEAEHRVDEPGETG